MNKSIIFKIILLLALVQGIAVMARAFNWVQIGVDLFGQGLLLLPFMGAVAVMRGLLISIVALLYVLFVIGGLLGKSWVWFCLTAVIINLLLVLSALFQGAALTQALLWSVIPIILLVYIFSQKGLNSAQEALNIQ
jgi:hypothetical protein